MADAEAKQDTLLLRAFWATPPSSDVGRLMLLDVKDARRYRRPSGCGEQSIQVASQVSADPARYPDRGVSEFVQIARRFSRFNMIA